MVEAADVAVERDAVALSVEDAPRDDRLRGDPERGTLPREDRCASWWDSEQRGCILTILAIMFLGGASGGAINAARAYRPAEPPNSWLRAREAHPFLQGIVATALVPLLNFLFQGDLLTNLSDDPLNMFVLFGLSLLAALGFPPGQHAPARASYRAVR